MTKQQDVRSLKVCMSSVKNNNKLYKDQAERLNTILGEDKHLHQLKQLSDARMAFIEEFGLSHKTHIPFDDFKDWLLDRWGVALKTTDVMGGLAGFDVADEQKFLLFCMVFP